MEVIWVGTERNYFLLWDSTDPTTPNLARRASSLPNFRNAAVRHADARHVHSQHRTGYKTGVHFYRTP
jgi:hypothetical protein